MAPIVPNTIENNPNTAPTISLKKTTNKIIAKTTITLPLNVNNDSILLQR